MPLRIHPEVEGAILDGRPVVALESTVLTHGLPMGDGPLENLGVARMLEAEVRAHGAVPATIAVIEGVLHVGLDPDGLHGLCATAGPMKLSARDLGVAVAKAHTGGTTVAATVTIAHQAGVRVLATGGIGGVHRGWAGSMDVSADLAALARTAICCVSAGAKNLLDLDATLEWIESLGIAAVGHGTDWLPHFTSVGDASRPLPTRIDEIPRLAAACRVHFGLCRSAFLVFQDPPAEHALPSNLCDAWTSQAIAEARAGGACGSLETPFVLRRVAELSSGRSVQANVALLRSNAALAAKIASELSNP
ncbi:MAG: pseudouridine-5'-phosphate glycosidase [Planctomycetota bacterium]|nr:pseudouridine-5'-phosphate glycosidase [Planctomycetota bacterium]